MRKLYMVTLKHAFTGDVVAGGHFLANSASEARTVGAVDLLAHAPASFTMSASYCFVARRSNASSANALNRDAA